MKNFFIAIATIFSVSIAAQSLSPREKQLFDIHKKSYSYDPENSEKEATIRLIKWYYCMEKHYNFNPLDFYEFKTENQLRKEKLLDENNNDIYAYENDSLHFSAYAKLDYVHRIEMQKAYKKCIKKSDIDY